MSETYQSTRARMELQEIEESIARDVQQLRDSLDGFETDVEHGLETSPLNIVERAARLCLKSGRRAELIRALARIEGRTL